MSRQWLAQRPQKLAEIEQSLDHKLTLKSWDAQLTASSYNLNRCISSRNSSSSQLFQILALFFVLQGLILIAVAQASAIKCQHSWLIFALSAMVSVATLSACIQKLREIAKGQRMYFQEKAICSALFNSIEQLKERGVDFDLQNGQPKLRGFFTGQWSSSQICSFYKTWMCSYAGAVLFLLVAFSGVTLGAVRLIVCDPQGNT